MQRSSKHRNHPVHHSNKNQKPFNHSVCLKTKFLGLLDKQETFVIINLLNKFI